MGKASSSKKVARAARAGGRRKVRGQCGLVFPIALGVVVLLGLGLIFYARNNNQAAEGPNRGQIRIPTRRPTPLFEGKEGKQKTEIHFDPVTHMVTVKLLVQDPNGYFIPNIRRDNFVVYENDIRQHNATVEIEHAPVTLGLLMEFGGRAQALSRLLGIEVARAGRQLLDELGREDKVPIWKYGDKVEKLADFSQGHETLDRVFQDLGTPEFSETNLYDALIYVVEQMRPVEGRKAIVLISSGVDTFSKAKYEEVLRAARDSDTPIYVISLAPVLRYLIEAHGATGPLARVDWSNADRELQEIARTSGGRVMSTIENDSAGSESWDPAIWSIGTVLGIAIVYLACLT